MIEDDLMDFRAFRDLLRISDAGLRIRITKKQVPEPFKIGRKLYWRRKDIEAWIDKKSQEGGGRK